MIITLPGYKKHSSISMSSSDRWINCSGSQLLINEMPPMDNTTEDSFAGNVAHYIAAEVLKHYTQTGISFPNFLGAEFRSQCGNFSLSVDSEMLDNISVYVDYCLSLIDGASDTFEVGVEVYRSLKFLEVPGLNGGFIDFELVDHGNKVIHTVDLKYGVGTTVEAEGNSQIAGYAIASANHVNNRLGGSWNMFYMHGYTSHRVIVQPRVVDGAPVKDVTESVAKLRGWVINTLGPSAGLAMTPGGKLTPGDWCRHCPLKHCAVRAKPVVESVRDVEGRGLLSGDISQGVKTLSDEQITHLVLNADKIRGVLAAVEAYAESRIKHGYKGLPALKVVNTRGRRHVDERMLNDPFNDHSLDIGEWLDELYDRKIKPIGEIEKVLRKKLKARGEKNIGGKSRAIIDSFCVKRGGTALVPADDKRPSINEPHPAGVLLDSLGGNDDAQ